MQEPGLPVPAYVISRVRPSAVGALVSFPVLVFFSYGRLFRSGLPISRLINPGVITLLVALPVAMAMVCVPRIGRPTVVAGMDWIASRGLFARKWRTIPLEQADRFCRRTYHSRTGAKSVLTVLAPNRQRVTFSFPAGDPALDELMAGCRAVGAHEVDSLRSFVGRRAVIGVSALIGIAVLPIAYLEIGPLRLLPDSIAGAFTWSGCRASLAAEHDKPQSSAAFVVAQMSADGTIWRFTGERQLDAAEFAANTEDPSARLAHLRSDDFVNAYDAFLQDPQGTVVAVAMLRFATPANALDYDHYVNRAVCEREYGAHGPRPTEVRFHRGSSALVRWVSGSTIMEVVQTPSHPFATRTQIEAIAAQLGRGSGSA